jgi:hypothetical protein
VVRFSNVRLVEKRVMQKDIILSTLATLFFHHWSYIESTVHALVLSLCRCDGGAILGGISILGIDAPMSGDDGLASSRLSTLDEAVT